ncbi:MAG: GNAT family N-acetyltransferase [Bacteroidia bacterium]|nr:GNAT family N-acetyltransferase [Bacteroidia bacterium]
MSEKILETERLSIVEAEITDSVFIYTLLNSRNWIKYIGDREINTLEDAERYIENSLFASYDRFGFGLYKVVLKSENKPIGLCGFLKRKELQHPDLGFAILPRFEGQGITSEASKAMLNHGFTKLNMKTVLGITTELNKASQRVLSKTGLSKAGTTRLAGGEELLLYQVTND